MNDQQVRLFVDVVDLGSFSAAARRHFVTPQSVSQQIRRLEGELGFALLDRTLQGVRPTAAGLTFHEGCARMIGELDDLLARCSEEVAGERGSVRLGSSHSYSMALFSRFVPTLLREHPELHVEYEEVPEHPLEGLLQGAYDLIEGVRPTSRAFAFQPLARIPRCALVLPSSPLAARAIITPADLVDRRVYVFNLQWADNLRAYLDEHCPQVELHELPAPDYESVRRVTTDEVVHLMPENLAGRFEEFIPIPFDSEVFTEYGLVYLPRNEARLHEVLHVARRVFGIEEAAEEAGAR